MAAGSHGTPTKASAFINGQWFDGTGFTEGTWYSVQGRLTRAKPAGLLEVVDLDNAYVVPPFGEAHNHNVGGPWEIDGVIQRYLTDGVFYVKIPGDIAEHVSRIREQINAPTSIDVVFSHGGLTATGGHPAPLYEDSLAVSRYEPIIGHVEKGWFRNRAYYFVDNEADLEREWAGILATKPDFLKTFLAHSEEFGRPRDPGHATRHRGLDPALLPRIVTKAHASGLRVSTHVETAADFRAAVTAGVDEITHLPGWWVPDDEDIAAARITEDDAKRAAAAGVVVVTTTVAGRLMPGHAGRSSSPQEHGSVSDLAHPAQNQADGPAVLEVQRHNLRLLYHHGVTLAVGSDHADTSLAEAQNLRSLGVFNNLTLLKLWCETTAAAIFPGRKIGRLEEGYEASFLVLTGNPIDDFNNVQGIRLRVKQGHLLVLPHPEFNLRSDDVEEGRRPHQVHHQP
jgi:imidazolonepropionase-like amidohydrolase